MDKIQLREQLINELWRMNKMDIIVHLMEFVEGETVALGCLIRHDGGFVNPSRISEEMNISRARTANILSSLRKKGFITMDIAEDDRRRMSVALTEKGRTFFLDKYNFLVEYFDLYVEVIGEKDIAELIRLLRKTVDSEKQLAFRPGARGENQ